MMRGGGLQLAVAQALSDPPLPRLEYCDEAVRDPSQAPPVDVHQPPAFLHKLLQLESSSARHSPVLSRFPILIRQVAAASHFR